MSSCCVVGCKNVNVSGDCGIAFYKFPKDESLRKKWVEAIQRPDWKPDKDSVICSVHFVTGQKSEHSWHPDYVPSVFRALRTVRPPKKPRYEDESPPPGRKTPGVKKQVSASSPAPRKFSPPVTSRTPKTRPSSNGFAKKKDSFIKKVLALQTGRTATRIPYKPMPKSKKRARSEKSPTKESIDEARSPSPIPSKVAKGNLEDVAVRDFSIVVERISEEVINQWVKQVVSSDSEEEEEAPPPKSPVKVTPSETKKVKKPELKKPAVVIKSSEKCKKCSNMEVKCKKLEGEIEGLEKKLKLSAESKQEKVQEISGLEQKIKKMDALYQKSQVEIAELKTKLGAIEVTEDAFRRYKSKVKMYTGLPNFDTLMLIFDHVKPALPEVPIKSLTPFQMFTLVLMRMKLNLPFWDLTYRFGTTPNIIQAFLPQYVAAMESRLAHAVLWPRANLQYRLYVLAGNLKQSYAIVDKPFDVKLLMITGSTSHLSEDEKLIRVCAALYHIAQLVSSNHSQQLLRILNLKPEDIMLSVEAKKTEEKAAAPEEEEKKTSEMDGKQDVSGEQDMAEREEPAATGSVALECKALHKELCALKEKVSAQLKFYTGLSDLDVFNKLLQFLESSISHLSSDKLSYSHQLLLVLTRFKLNALSEDVAFVFKVDVDYVVYVTKQWLDVMSEKLSKYVGLPAGVENQNKEKSLRGVVKLKYSILWTPNLAAWNQETGRDREKIVEGRLLRVCAALCNIEDVEIFKSEKPADVVEGKEDNGVAEADLEKRCQALRNEIFELRKVNVFNTAMLTEEYLKEHEVWVKYYTGFKTYESLMEVFNTVYPTDSSDTACRILKPFDQFMITLSKLKLNLPSQDLAYRYGVCLTTIHRVFYDWLSLLHQQLAYFITMPDDDEDCVSLMDTVYRIYRYLSGSGRKPNQELRSEMGMHDIPTLVCLALYNIGGDPPPPPASESDFDSFDEDW